MFSLVRPWCQMVKIGLQNAVLLSCLPPVQCTNSMSNCSYLLLRGLKQLTCSGYITSVQGAGSFTKLMFSDFASGTVARAKWVMWPSKTKSLGLVFTFFINLSNLSWNIVVVIHLLSLTAKEVSFTVFLPNQEDCKFFPLNIIRGWTTLPSAEPITRTFVFSWLQPYVTWMVSSSLGEWK